MQPSFFPRRGHRRTRVHAERRPQRGFTLIETMAALLIFGVGVLGIARLQSVAVQETSTAAFRSTAALLAKNLIGRMWLSDRTASTLQTNFASPSGSGYTAWLSAVTAANLPNSATFPPTVSFASGGGTAPVATITIFWKAPGDTAVHQYVETAQIK